MMKFSKTIAMILILVMLACSFTGCEVMKTIGYVALTILLLALYGLTHIIIIIEAPSEAGIYLAGTDADPFANYYSPEYFSAMQRLNALPESERIALMEKINTLPEEKHASLVSDAQSLPDSEINALMKEINTLTEEEFLSAVLDFNTLSEEEMDALLRQLNERAARFSLMSTVAVLRKQETLVPAFA